MLAWIVFLSSLVPPSMIATGDPVISASSVVRYRGIERLLAKFTREAVRSEAQPG